MPCFAASLQDLQKGSKLLAADGTPIEVLKVEVQKTKKLLDLERLGPINYQSCGAWQATGYELWKRHNPRISVTVYIYIIVYIYI